MTWGSLENDEKLKEKPESPGIKLGVSNMSNLGIIVVQPYVASEASGENDRIGEPSSDGGNEMSLPSISPVKEKERSDDLGELRHDQDAGTTCDRCPKHDEESSVSLPPASVSVTHQISAAWRSHVPQSPEYSRSHLQILKKINTPEWLSNVDRTNRRACMRAFVELWRAVCVPLWSYGEQIHSTPMKTAGLQLPGLRI